MQSRHSVITGIALALCAGFASAQDIKIAHVYDKTGPLGAYAMQTQAGLMMGLEYATGGTMAVNGHKLVVIEKDNQGKPDVAKAMLEAAYADDKAAIAVGPTSSGAALAMLPVAEQYKKILLVEPAVADDITGIKWNRYIFRTGRCSSQDAVSNAIVLDKPGVSSPPWPRTTPSAGTSWPPSRAPSRTPSSCTRSTCRPRPPTSPPAPSTCSTSSRTSRARKIIFINWAGSNAFKIADLKPERYGIEIATGGNILPALALYKPFPGMEGAAYYYYENPQEQGQRLARGGAQEALQQRAPRLLHRRRNGRGHGHRRDPQEDQGRRGHREPHQDHGGHVLRDPQGQDGLPQGGPPGAAGRCTTSRSRSIPMSPGRFPNWSGRSPIKDMDIPIRNKVT